MKNYFIIDATEEMKRNFESQDARRHSKKARKIKRDTEKMFDDLFKKECEKLSQDLEG